MIATILPSSTNFHAVEYNEMKVAMGKAELIEMYNFGYIEDMGCQSPEELTNYLVAYSSANQRIKKAQFHLAISCKGNEYSQEELVRIAHQYLKDMGYGEPGQPLLIYAHHDTDNNHIHIITSRVNPHGKKIYHNHERLHSQEVINRIMGVDEKQRVGKAVTDALHYSFLPYLISRRLWKRWGMSVSKLMMNLFSREGDSYKTGLNWRLLKQPSRNITARTERESCRSEPSSKNIVTCHLTKKSFKT